MRETHAGRSVRIVRRLASIFVAIFVAGGILFTGATAAALGPEASEALVRALWFEGLPRDEAAQIDADGARHLATLLADPDERDVHANALLALAYSGQPAALPALIAWASEAPEGEVDRATFRAWQVLPIALGALAKNDRRALRRLDALLQGEPAAWRFRHHTPERIERMCKEGAATALAGTGLAEADALLARAEAGTGDGAFRSHVQRVRAEARSRGGEGR